MTRNTLALESQRDARLNDRSTQRVISGHPLYQGLGEYILIDWL